VFWTRFLEERSSNVPASTSLVSKDIDFEGSARAVRRAADLLTARARIASIDDHMPNTGIVLFLDADGVEREIDFIDEPLGLRARDVRDTGAASHRTVPLPTLAGKSASGGARSAILGVSCGLLG